MFDGLSLTWPWNLEAFVFLLLLSLLYVVGVWRVSRRMPRENTVPMVRILLFCAGIVIVAVLLLTPIDTIGRTQLFSVHMTQVVILTTVCAPLLLGGCPALLLKPLAELPVVSGIVRALTRPLVASVLFNLNFLLWHAPKFYSMAQVNVTLYHMMLLSIFFTSMLNWWPLIGSVDELRRISYPMQMVYAFFDGQPADIFAFVLVFTGVPIYRLYAIPSQLGLSAFADQAVAGALLLIPGLVDLGVMTPLFFRWLGQIERRTQLGDQRRQEEMEVEEEEVEETSEA